MTYGVWYNEWVEDLGAPPVFHLPAGRVFHSSNLMSLFYGVFLTSSWNFSWCLVLWHLCALIADIPRLGHGMYLLLYGGLVQNRKYHLPNGHRQK